MLKFNEYGSVFREVWAFVARNKRFSRYLINCLVQKTGSAYRAPDIARAVAASCFAKEIARKIAAGGAVAGRPKS